MAAWAGGPDAMRECCARRLESGAIEAQKQPGNTLRGDLVTLCKEHGRMKFVRAAKEDVRVVPEPVIGRETLPRDRHIGPVGDLPDEGAQ